MTIGHGLTAIGLVAEGIGVVVTGLGFRGTWRHFAGTRRLFADAGPVVAAKNRARQAKLTTETVLRRIARHPRPVSVQPEPDELRFKTGLAAVLIAPEPLDPSLDPAEAIARIDARTRELSARLSREENRRAEGDAEVSDRVTAVDERVDRVQDTLDAKVDLSAIEGLRVALLGVVLILIGIVFQLAAQFAE